MKRLVALFGRATASAGAALERTGLKPLEKPVFKETVSKHRNVTNFFDKHPWTSPDVYVAPNATVIGAVDINLKSAVGYGAVVRGDLSRVNIGAYTVIGDRAVITTSPFSETDPLAAVDIGDYVIVGAGSQLQSCKIERGAKIGPGSVVMEGALVEEYSDLAPGSVVHPGRRIPKGQEWGGNPAQFVRDLSKAELNHKEAEAEEAAEAYLTHGEEFLPVGFSYVQAEELGLDKK